MTIEVPEPIKSKMILLDDLTANWTDYDQMYITQSLGEKWVNENETAILQVPSSIISEEVNYLINPNHKDFEKIKVIKNQPFVFDKRIKQ